MRTPEFDFIERLAAQPGFWVLEVLNDEDNAPEGIHRHAVVAWGIDRDMEVAIPITVHGPQDWRAILRPDGVVDMAHGGFYQSEAALLKEVKEDWAATHGKVS